VRRLKQRLTVGISFAILTEKFQPEEKTVWDMQTESFENMAESLTMKISEGDLLVGLTAVVMGKIIAATRGATT
jgi:hypothetical protein